MEKKKAMVTINWRGKENKRGLTETAIETLRRVGEKANRPILIEDADKLAGEYFKMYDKETTPDLKQLNIFSFERELEMVKQYVRVRL